MSKVSITTEEALDNTEIVNAVCDLMDKYGVTPNVFKKMYKNILDYRDAEVAEDWKDFHSRL